MPEVILNCPQCQRQLRVTEELIGRPVKCPACGLTFTVPAGSTEPQIAPAPVVPEPAPPAPRPRAPHEDYGPDTGFAREREYDEPRYERAGEPWDYDRRDIRRARSMVTAPAICMLIASILGILVDVGQIFLAMTPAPPVDPNLPPIFQEALKSSHGPAAMIGGGLFAALSLVVLIASIQMMRLGSHGFSVAGSVLAMINIGNCCCLLGLPFGIWSLVVLSKPEVKRAFQAAQRRSFDPGD